MQMGSWGREKCEIKLTFLKQDKPESNVLENELWLVFQHRQHTKLSPTENKEGYKEIENSM